MNRASCRPRTSPSDPSALIGKVTTAGPGSEVPPPQAVARRATVTIEALLQRLDLRCQLIAQLGGGEPRVDGCRGRTGWQVDPNCRALVAMTGDPYVPAMLFHDAVDHGQTQSHSVSEWLGREEWLKYPGKGRPIHSPAGV